MFEILGTLLTGVLSGGATGLIGVLIQRFFDLQHKKQDLEQLKLRLENAKELALIESERAKRAGELELEGKFVETDASILTASFKHDAASYLAPDAQQRKGWVGGMAVGLMAVVDFVRGILRPGMTAYLCWLVTVMFFWARDVAQANGVHLTAEHAMQIVVQVIATILYVFTTSALWWFGTRPPKQGR